MTQHHLSFRADAHSTQKRKRIIAAIIQGQVPQITIMGRNEKTNYTSQTVRRRIEKPTFVKVSVIIILLSKS